MDSMYCVYVLYKYMENACGVWILMVKMYVYS